MSREGKILIGILVVVVGGMIAIFMLANGGSTTTTVADPGKLVRENSHKIGNGPVQVVEFSDFQCPACGGIQPAVAELLAKDGANITLVYRNFPLPMHNNANAAALAAEAAGAQGKYWEMSSKIFETQTEWSDLTSPTAKFIEYATNLGLDAEKFKNSIDNKEFQSVIDTDVADGTALNVNATPTFYVDGVAVNNVSGYDSLKAAVDAALAKKQ